MTVDAARFDAGTLVGDRRRVVIVTNHVPGHDLGLQQSGHARYLQGFLDYFRRAGSDVVLVVLQPNVDFVVRRASALGYRISSPQFDFIGDWIVVRSARGIARLLAWKVYVRLPRGVQVAADAVRLALRKRRGFTHTLGRFLNADEVAYVKDVVDKENPDVILFDGVFNSCSRLSDAQHWVITHEVKHQRAAAFADHGVSVIPASFGSQTERAILEKAGNVIAIQWDDAREFKRLTPSSRVVVVPVPMKLPKLRRGNAPSAGRCLFVGSGSFHNLHGVRWFLDECWPKIRAVLPTATLDIVGSVCYRLSNDVAGVTFHGVVGNLQAIYERAAVTIVPLQIGSGLKVKLVEALAYEQAIVTTGVGAQGLGGFSSVPFVVADTSEDFAARTLELLASPAHQHALRMQAAEFARLFDPQAAFAEFAASTAPQFEPV